MAVWWSLYSSYCCLLQQIMLNYTSVTGFPSSFHIYRLWYIIPLLKTACVFNGRWVRCMLLYYLTAACIYTFTLLCSSHAFQEIAFVILPSLLSPWNQQRPVSGFLATALFCAVQLVLFPKEQSRLLSDGMPASFVLQKEQLGCSWT